MKIALVQFETKIRQSFSVISRRVIDFIKKAKKTKLLNYLFS